LFGQLQPLTSGLGRPVNPAIYTRKELAKSIKEENPFLTRVLAQPKLWIYGSDDELAA
jgi:hypothetical protein